MTPKLLAEVNSLAEVLSMEFNVGLFWLGIGFAVVIPLCLAFTLVRHVLAIRTTLESIEKHLKES